MSEATKKQSSKKTRPVTAAVNKKGSMNNIKGINTSRIKANLSSINPKQNNKLPALKNPQTNKTNVMTGKASQNRKTSSIEEPDKDLEPSQTYNSNPGQSIKEMVEQGWVGQRAISMIEDTLYLFSNKGEVKGAGIEKYELINKDEFEKMKKENEELRLKKNVLKEEYNKLKDEYEKVTYELNNHNHKYNTTEKAKTDSITKLYSMETELKKMIVNNSKLQNEIQKEVQAKNNIFRALNEFKRKYEKNITQPELKEIFAKIKDEKYNPVNGLPKSDKIGYLEDKLESLKKDLQTKEDTISQLSKKIRETTESN